MTTIIKQILKSMLYKKSFILLLLSISIPLALSGSLLSIPNSINTIEINSTSNFITINISLATLKNDNKSIQVNVLSSNNESYILNYFNINLLYGKEGVLVSNSLNISKNSKIILCSSGSCNSYQVTGIINTPNNLNLVILPSYNQSTRITVGGGLKNIMSSMLSSLRYLSIILSFILITLSFPAQYFSYKKIYLSLSDAFNNLKYIGISHNKIKLNYLIVSLIISTLFTLYGLAFGIIIFQLGISVLYHLNYANFIINTPGLYSLIIVSLYSIVVSTISSYFQVLNHD